jgi:hypothetical protein
MISALAVMFLEFDHYVIKLFRVYKELSLLKFGSRDFYFFRLFKSWICFTKNHEYLYVFFYALTLLKYVSL